MIHDSPDGEAPDGGGPDVVRPPRADGRLLVGFDPGAGRLTQARALAQAGVRALGRTGDTTVVALPAGVDAEGAAAGLAHARGVAFAEPDYLRATHSCADCWYLDPAAGPRPGAGVRDLHAAGVTGADATVAVLDVGVGETPDLDGQVLSRRACVPRCGPAGAPAGAHGTLVASLIAAKDDGQGITGVAPGAKVRSWQVNDSSDIPTSAVVAALDEVAADPEIGVVNMSFGGAGRSRAERAAVERVLAAGKVVVASSGNDGSYVPQYPAAYPGVLSVGAAGPDGRVAEFTSYGKLDLVAPGACLPATGSDGSSGMARCPLPAPAGMIYITGTSFAAPVVSGVLALRRADTPLRSRLGVLGTARSEPPAGLDDRKRWGHGRADAAAWAASFADAAAPYLVAEAANQLPYQGASTPTTWHAYLLRSAGSPPDAPRAGAAFTGATTGAAPFAEVEPGVLAAALPSGPLESGTAVAEASASVPGGTLTASAAARVLRPDDQAPGVTLPGSAPWRVSGSLQGGGAGPSPNDDTDDVYAVELAAGDTLDASLRAPAHGRLALALFAPGTTDVFGETDQVVAHAAASGDSVTRLTHTADQDGTYLLDVYAPGLESGAPGGGDYALTIAAPE